MQETWLAVIKGIDRFQGRSSLRTWVFHVLTNIARRQGTKERRTIPTSPVDDPDSSPTIDPNRFRPAGDQGRWVARRDRPTVLGAGGGGRAARRRGVQHPAALSPANQRVLLHRARAKLRDTPARSPEHP